jgi:hypothetical protein
MDFDEALNAEHEEQFPKFDEKNRAGPKTGPMDDDGGPVNEVARVLAGESVSDR